LKIQLFIVFVMTTFVIACGGRQENPDFLNEELVITPLKSGLNNAIINSKSRGRVKLEVYLPPTWNKNTTETYPVVYFLHGQGGRQTDFFDTVKSSDLDAWINQGELPSFVLVSIQSDYENGEEQQWSSAKNEIFLTSKKYSELRAYTLKYFKAGDDLDTNKIKKTSIQGHSRGARGALHYAVKFPKDFTSAVSDAFVSDYALSDEKNNAVSHSQEFIDSGIKLRMSVGDKDNFEQNKQVSLRMHNYLKSIGLPHEYEVLADASHNFYTIWNSVLESSQINGLYELKFHAQSWR